jgi:hypothetical protein
MSDLALFVAAFLREKVLDDLLEENKQLRAQLKANITSSRKVRISGRGGEIYAEAQLDEDGHCILEGYWHLDLKAGTAQCSSMEHFRAIELHIGDLHKVVLASNVPVKISATLTSTTLSIVHSLYFVFQKERHGHCFSVLYFQRVRLQYIPIFIS